MLHWLAAKIDCAGAAAKRRQFQAGWPATSRKDIRFAQVGDVLFRYRMRGSGRPIVFAADPPVTLEAYDSLIEHYAPSFRVLVFELPSMGFSVPDFWFDFRFRPTNDSIAAFVRTIVGEPAVFAFSCVAGLGALDIAGRYPELVSHLVQIQTPDWRQEVAWKHSRDPRRILSKPIFGQLAMQRLKASRVRPWLDLAVGKRAMIPGLCACATETIKEGAGWALATAFQNYLHDEPPSLRRLAQPMLAIWGVEDGSHRQTDRSTSLWLSDNTDSRMIEFNGLGHFPELEDVAKVHSEIVRFLDAVTS